MRLGFSHGVQLRWNGYFLVGEENRGRNHGEHPSACTGKNQAQPIFHRANLFTRSCFIPRQHCSSHQQERCRQRRFARINSSGVGNALYMSFQAHQVRIYPNLDIQYSRFNSVLRGELPCSPGCIVVNF